MILRIELIFCFLSVFLATGQSTAPKTQGRIYGSNRASSVAVPEDVEALIRPLLDLRQKSIDECGEAGTPSKCVKGDAYEREQKRQIDFSELLMQLTRRNKSNREYLVGGIRGRCLRALQQK
jgi:hypothetical protein